MLGPKPRIDVTLRSMNFVKTEILSSSDGISHSESQRIDSSESEDARRRAAGNGLTLYQQLEEKREKEQEAYAKTTKLLFAPPKALEEDDFAFIEAEKKKEKALADAAEREAVLAFEHAKSQYAPLTKAPPSLRLKKQEDQPQIIAKFRRRRLDPRPSQDSNQASPLAREDKSKPSLLAAPPHTQQRKRPVSSLTALVACYDDDSTSETEDKTSSTIKRKKQSQ